MKLIIISVVLSVVLNLVLRIITRIRSYRRLKQYAEKPFACPNCGHIFYVKWYNLILKETVILMRDKAPLKCPKCKMRDMCSRPSVD